MEGVDFRFGWGLQEQIETWRRTYSTLLQAVMHRLEQQEHYIVQDSENAEDWPAEGVGNDSRETVLGSHVTGVLDGIPALNGVALFTC